MRWVGFNFQWMFSWSEGAVPSPPDLRALDFLSGHGFNFVRATCDYRFWTRDWDYLHPDLRQFETLRGYYDACRERGIHFSLNMHRVPGYCINQPEIEKHNLWVDREAQDGFVAQWEAFARFFRDVLGDKLSFDLMNEPPNIGQYGMTRDIHEALIRRTVTAIRNIDPDRTIVINGLEGGNVAMPELGDLGLVQSGRGYQPMPVSHQGASWWDGWKGQKAIYPGGDWMGHSWDRQALDAFFRLGRRSTGFTSGSLDASTRLPTTWRFGG